VGGKNTSLGGFEVNFLAYKSELRYTVAWPQGLLLGNFIFTPKKIDCGLENNDVPICEISSICGGRKNSPRRYLKLPAVGRLGKEL